MGRKHCGKRKNCSLRAFFLFPTVFSKGLFPRGVKRCHCIGMGLAKTPFSVDLKKTFILTLLLMTKEALVDSVNQDQTAQNVHPDL